LLKECSVEACLVYKKDIFLYIHSRAIMVHLSTILKIALAIALQISLIVVIVVIVRATAKKDELETFVGETPIVIPSMHEKKFKAPSETRGRDSKWKSFIDKANEKTTSRMRIENVATPYELSCKRNDGTIIACGDLPIYTWNVHGDFKVEINK
jgi:hypothetical protein